MPHHFPSLQQYYGGFNIPRKVYVYDFDTQTLTEYGTPGDAWWSDDLSYIPLEERQLRESLPKRVPLVNPIPREPEEYLFPEAWWHRLVWCIPLDPLVDVYRVVTDAETGKLIIDREESRSPKHHQLLEFQLFRGRLTSELIEAMRTVAKRVQTSQVALAIPSAHLWEWDDEAGLPVSVVMNDKKRWETMTTIEGVCYAANRNGSEARAKEGASGGEKGMERLEAHTSYAYLDYVYLLDLETQDLARWGLELQPPEREAWTEGVSEEEIETLRAIAADLHEWDGISGTRVVLTERTAADDVDGLWIRESWWHRLVWSLKVQPSIRVLGDVRQNSDGTFYLDPKNRSYICHWLHTGSLDDAAIQSIKAVVGKDIKRVGIQLGQLNIHQFGSGAGEFLSFAVDCPDRWTEMSTINGVCYDDCSRAIRCKELYEARRSYMLKKIAAA